MALRRKRNGKIAKILSLVILTVSLGGCGTAGNGGGGSGSAGNSNGQGGELSPEAMGRYVEEVSDLSAKISGDGSGIYPLDNGNLIVTDRYMEFIKTDNNGAIWMTDHRRWRTKMLEKGTYIMSMAVGPDNTVALIYQGDAEEVNRVEGEAESGEEAESSAGTDSAEEGTGAEDLPLELNPRLLLIKPDNTEIPIDIALTEDDQYLDRVYISDAGRIFVTTRGNSNLYEVKEDGSSELFLMVEAGHPNLIQFQGNLMVMDGYAYDSLAIYDLDKKEYIEDDVLAEFMETNYRDRTGSSIDSYGLYFFFGEEGIIYLAGEEGLYRHVIGGSAMEQLIDGKLCSLGNPAYNIQSMIALENNEFLALFEGSRMIHYVYDPDIPTKPSEKLVVYGLEDNETIRQAINLYQTQNPEVYIEFECGMSGDNSVTREDALKSLNTKIMAGEGPDILLLDNMPLSSYIDKGMLLDLSSFLSQLSGEEVLLENILDAVKTDEQIFMVPCEIKLPVMMAEKQYLSQADSLEGIADMMEKLREEEPEQDLFGYCSEKGILRLFSITCAPAWMTENGDMNKEAVREFLQQTKRIYDAQMDGISDRAVERYQETAQAYEMYNGVPSFEDSDYVRVSGINKMNYIGGYYRALFGNFSCIDLVSIQKIEGFENVEWVPMKGQGGNVFCAETLLSINAASENIELAEDFLKVCLGRENQSYLYDSLAVNETAYEESFLLPDEAGSDGRWGSVVTDGEDGERIVLIYYWPLEEEASRYKAYIEELDTAYIENDMVENVVYEEGTAYLRGTKNLEETVDAIEKKVSIYLSE
ncbi:MAG: extracellular solute-binding protein [Lachnospiraceae bacterium]|nr:extracellular solute-binding protein [Lachnospiraceae bacterium]